MMFHPNQPCYFCWIWAWSSDTFVVSSTFLVECIFKSSWIWRPDCWIWDDNSLLFCSLSARDSDELLQLACISSHCCNLEFKANRVVFIRSSSTSFSPTSKLSWAFSACTCSSTVPWPSSSYIIAPMESLPPTERRYDPEKAILPDGLWSPSLTTLVVVLFFVRLPGDTLDYMWKWNK